MKADAEKHLLFLLHKKSRSSILDALLYFVLNLNYLTVFLRA